MKMRKPILISILLELVPVTAYAACPAREAFDRDKTNVVSQITYNFSACTLDQLLVMKERVLADLAKFKTKAAGEAKTASASTLHGFERIEGNMLRVLSLMNQEIILQTIELGQDGGHGDQKSAH